MLAGFALAGIRLFTFDFWYGLIHPHYPRMGRTLQEVGADHLYANTRQAMEIANKEK